MDVTPDKILETAIGVDPMWGIVVGLLLMMLAGAVFTVRVLWKENRTLGHRDRESLERAYVLLDKVADGIKAAEMDRDRRVAFETKLEMASVALNEAKGFIAELIKDARRDILSAIDKQ